MCGRCVCACVRVAHLDEGVQSFSVHLQELGFDVHHVDLSTRNHHSDQYAVSGA